ncbi:MAG TPA: CHAD domain-containing protein [Candidatus Binataceae bacterium]|nr:CHAD domain-containing protein [Candidatus Binataceae bacterium]
MVSADEPDTRKLRLAPEESIANAALATLAFGAQALERERGAAVSGGVEPIHQLRVASRRLRAAIEMFSGSLYAAQAGLLRRDLTWLAQIAGKVRESDVIGDTIRARAPKLEPKLAALLAPLYSELEVSRRLALAELGEALSSPRCAATLARLRKPRIRVAMSSAALGPAAATILATMTRAMSRAGAPLAVSSIPEAVHRLRVRVKRMRYALEMLAALGGKRNRKALVRLEAMQDRLGSFNDAIVAIRWLIAYASAEGAPPEAVLAAGAMAESLRRRERKLARRAMKAWRKFESGEIMRAAIDETRRHGHGAHHANTTSAETATETTK